MQMKFLRFVNELRGLIYTTLATIFISYIGIQTPINKDSMKLNANEYRVDILENKTIQESAFGRTFIKSSMVRSSSFILKWVKANPSSRLSAIVHFVSFKLENEMVVNDSEKTRDSILGNPFQIALRAFEGANFKVVFDDDCKVAQIEGVDSFRNRFLNLYYSANSSADPKNGDVYFPYSFFVEYFQLILPIPVDTTGELLSQELERPAIPGEPLRTQVAIRTANISDTEWDYNSLYSVDQVIGQNSDNQVPTKGSGVGTVKLDAQTGGVRSNIYDIDANGSIFLASGEVKLNIRCHSETRVEKGTGF